MMLVFYCGIVPVYGRQRTEWAARLMPVRGRAADIH